MRAQRYKENSKCKIHNSKLHLFSAKKCGISAFYRSEMPLLYSCAPTARLKQPTLYLLSLKS